MTVAVLSDVEFGTELPGFKPDTSLDNVRRFCVAAGWDGPRFTSHEAARELGFPGAIVPGVMSQGLLAAAIHRWAPSSRIDRMDTVFRAPVQVDQLIVIKAVVTDIDEDEGAVELDLTVVNDAGETRVFGTATVKFD
jgi:acyl dehydratase